MKYFTVIFLFCCIAVAAAGPTDSAPKLLPVIFNADRHVKFNLKRHNDSKNPHQLKFNSTINSEWMNREWKTFIFIHGWDEACHLTELMQNSYLSENDIKVNLIEVAWLKGIYSPAYFHSAGLVPSVGEIVAKFIGLNQDKFNFESLTIVGHSLGAHAAGYAGKFLQSNYKLTPRLIVGLDPAGPLFLHNKKKLQPNDAQDVLVIHTSQKLGHLEPLGTVDVYINGGKVQPGCSGAQSHNFAKIFYREFVIRRETLVGHKYSSFAEVKSGIIPKIEQVNLSQRLPLPPKGTLVYVGTEGQPQLIAEVFKNSCPSDSTVSTCSIL